MKYAAKQKLAPLGYSLEQQHDFMLCGIDEVGRGPLCGPVLSCCVHIPQEHIANDFWHEVTDSKMLSLKKRQYLFEAITAHSHYGIAIAAAEEVDSLNIHHATLLAMKRAYQNMRKHFGTAPRHAMIDGRFVPKLDCRAEAITKGDRKCLSIAAASILAKVSRDRIMTALAKEFPHYGWDTNAGYGTPQHLDGIKKFGVTKHHRRSFAPVRAAIESL